MDEKQRIVEMIEQLLPICESWIQEKGGSSSFVDPNDGVEISAHYGATHMAATLILYGKMRNQNTMYQKGILLLNSILNKWNQSKKNPEFHFDFNNFALCVIADIVKEDDVSLYLRIQQTVLHTEDSNHNTTNWLPMRWFVNLKRYEWTKVKKYKVKCSECRKGIKRATNADGGIEDIVPRGKSFNLQYDIATVGVLQFMRLRGEEYDLTRELNFLLRAVAPDGDVNYQGRGTNQLFAWGGWVYLLASAGRYENLAVALDYLETKVLTMYNKQNLMLNSYDGYEKYLWWDYHYCSVYCAHFLFWLMLALMDYDKLPITLNAKHHGDETGLHIYRTSAFFVATFDGRKKYLAENGPVVNAIWTREVGMFYKGSFGPWQGSFGKKYSNEFVHRNFCGLVALKSIENRMPYLFKRIAYKLGWHFSTTLEPLFCPISIIELGDGVVICYELKHHTRAIFNVPVLGLENRQCCTSLQVDAKPVQLIEVGNIRNQYGLCKIYQSREVKGVRWEFTIR